MTVESQRPTPERGAGTAVRDRTNARRGRSRMLDAYLGDIEYLMRERLWSEAVPLALALPHICVAIGDPQLRSSPHDYFEWCQNWVRPLQTESASTVPTADALFRMAQSRAEVPDDESGTAVPADALRRLRLRRLARAMPLRRRSALSELVRIDAAQEPEREAALALVEAVRRWYADRGAQDPTVQSNLARLAILR
ncbi:MAG TPA: hypothetical protein VMF03_09730 [Steroidobacteraceae bacterium]|nr:hypothetical protein [Steroidobacteraceae bacterium]